MLSIGINGNQDTCVAGSRLANPVPERRTLATIAWMRDEDRTLPPSLVPRPVC